MTDGERIASLETTSKLTYQLLQRIDGKLDAHVNEGRNIMTRSESFRAFALKGVEEKVEDMADTVNKGIWGVIVGGISMVAGLILLILNLK